ncbi:MAG TPA: hypothetical protein VK624_03725 [Steroidobacteraceae bacterium]|nr:hypothetical protein [Steroidobacteraceae bacterium]
MSEESTAAETVTFRDMISNAIRYWELRRVLYNAVLVVVVVLAFVGEWPEAQQALNFESLLSLFILAVLANVAYCAAYLPDMAFQYSSMRAVWLEWRFLLLALGILFAATLTYFFALSLARPWVD